mgnify:CR=1 FL=1
MDITSKLSNAKPTLKIAEGMVYEVNNSKNNILIVDQELKKSNKSEVEVIDFVVEKVLGEKALKEINALDLSIADYKVIFIAIMACVSGMSYEEAEKNMNTPR